jgi:hypothetical protein
MVSMKALRRLLALSSLAVAQADACTIVVITDGARVLFCNNEDWSNPRTRIWFIPGDDGRHGCAYVGFDDGWAQGGLNTDGLAFDWVAGFKEEWTPDPRLPTPKGNSAQRMLETCSRVEEAVAYYETHQEACFSYGKMLVADRSGASAVIGAKEGRLHVERMTASRVLTLGYRVELAERLLSEAPEASPTNAAKVLQAVRQEGKYATRYSNVFDLKSGEILVYRFPDQAEPVRLSLGEELKKGGHYYDVPELGEQLKEGLKGLTEEIKGN